MELQNRAKLVALADTLHARIALPRAPGRWSRRNAAAESIEGIDAAAAECFGGRDFVLLGFSDGANLVNQLFLDCRTDVTRRFVSVGSSEGLAGRRAVPESRCGRIALLAGHREPGFATTRTFARQLARSGATVTFVEHPGPHELPVEELLRFLEDDATNADEN
jgi:predicted esterase